MINLWYNELYHMLHLCHYEWDRIITLWDHGKGQMIISWNLWLDRVITLRSWLRPDAAFMALWVRSDDHYMRQWVRSDDNFMKSWVKQDYHFDIMIATRCCIYGTIGETRSSVYDTMSETMWSVYGTLSVTRCCIYDTMSETIWERMITLWY